MHASNTCILIETSNTPPSATPHIPSCFLKAQTLTTLERNTNHTYNLAYFVHPSKNPPFINDFAVSLLGVQRYGQTDIAIQSTRIAISIAIFYCVKEHNEKKPVWRYVRGGINFSPLALKKRKAASPFVHQTEWVVAATSVKCFVLSSLKKMNSRGIDIQSR